LASSFTIPATSAGEAPIPTVSCIFK
jgi:hypothetical protein